MVSIHWGFQPGAAYTAVFSMKHAGVWVELAAFNENDDVTREVRGTLSDVLPMMMGPRYKFKIDHVLDARYDAEGIDLLRLVTRAVLSQSALEVV
jgi:hypothetical protein